MPRISEEELVLPALRVMSTAINQTISTTDLISELTRIMNPTGEDLDILQNRNDTKFSQKVRNLKSHNKMEGLAIYTPSGIQGQSGTFRITSEGEALLNQ